MTSALIIVWRESVEAILVIAILYAWLRNNDARAGLRWLGYGVAAGLAVAAMLGAAMVALHASFEWFQALILFAAALLIVQMVGWMREHGRTLKRELESGAHKALVSGNFAGLALLAAIAVAREGAETVLFLYGLVVEQSGSGLAAVGAGAALGLIAAIATFWLLSSGARWMSWPTFFRVSEALLLVFASALVVGGVDRLLDMGVLLAEAPHWDSAWLIDDARGVGNVLQQFAGYRARPDTYELGAWLGYWLLAFGWLNRARLLKHA
ncbi:MAG TPA: FTR1 family protein [Burkholderiales bacterium]